MPWVVREKDGKHCVCKQGSDTPISGGCHATRGEAVKHLRALYAAEPDASMKYSVLALTDDLLVADAKNENTKWVKAWRYSTWEHPKYGTVEITPTTGERMSTHFHNGSLGREHLINFDHGVDPAKGGEAGGTILDIEPRDDGIYYKIEFHDDTLEAIRKKKWRYLSPEFDDWIDPETGEIFEDMPFDLALTNTPYFKHQPPLNFSEVFHEEKPAPKPKETKGGKAVDDLLKKAFAELGLDLDDDMDDDTVIKAAKELNETIEPLRRAKVEGARARNFREAFPDQYKEMVELKATKIESEAQQFAESYARFTLRDGENTWKSAYGFSQLVIEEIAQLHKKFSEKAAGHSDLRKLLDLIGDKGIVDYSEVGSSRVHDGKPFSDDPKQAFSEAITAAMNEDNLSYEAAMEAAKMKHPEIYEAYLRAVPQR